MFTEKSDIENWLKEMNIKNYVIKEDLTVNVKGGVYLLFKNLTEIPVQFGVVEGSFNCSNNELTNLKGCPRNVKGDFNCSSNKLTNLEHMPQKIGNDFNCNGNYLTSLESCPKTIKGGFYCEYNNLKTLENGPNNVGVDFYCGFNKLTSLKGSHKVVNGDFDCSFNYLTDLKYMPKQIGKDIMCDHNSLTSLKGIPDVINGSFDCSDNLFLNLDNIPQINNAQYVRFSMMCKNSLNEKELLKINPELLNEKIEFLLDVYIQENKETIYLSGKDILAIQEKHLLKNGITELENKNTM